MQLSTESGEAQILGLTASGSARGASPSIRRIAVLVGANDPPPGRSPLRFAHDDARELADVLEQVGGFGASDVHVLMDPHPPELIATLDSVARTAHAGEGDVLFVFYYSGHSDGQALFPHDEPVPIIDIRDRVERAGARIRVGILDACRGAAWTQSKGLSVGPPLAMGDLLNVDTEGTVLVSASSGMENAHESDAIHGSFFTHYLAAALRGAADREGDGTVTLQEAFDYAKEHTVRESARLTNVPQHPSFDLALRGRQDIVLAVVPQGTSALQIMATRVPLEIIHLPSGVTVADVPPSLSALRVALPPGRYMVRCMVNGLVFTKEVEVRAAVTSTLTEADLEATGGGPLVVKGPEPQTQPSLDGSYRGAAGEATGPPQAPPATAARGGSQRAIGLVIGGVGLAAAAAGVVTAVVAKSTWDDAAPCQPTSGCSPANASAQSHRAGELATASNVLLVSGVVGMGAGAAVFLLAPHANLGPNASVSFGVGPGATGVSLRARFGPEQVKEE